MKKLMLGNEAIARGAYEAGVRVATAYPGTPSTEITEYISTYPEINSEWSVNEKVALEVGIGSSIAGARTIVSMKHVGLNVAADPLMSISYPGVNGGLVVVVADDPGQHSSQNEQDSRYFGIFGKIPVLEPSDSQECKDFVGIALNMSEQFDTPVIYRTSTRVSHSQSMVEMEDRKNDELKAYDKNPNKYIVAPAVAKKRRVIAEAKMRKLEEFAETTPLNRLEEGNSEIGIITSGIAYQYAKEVLPDASFLKLGMSHPLPKEKITEFVKNHKTVYIIEELEPIFEEKIKSWGLNVIGKEIFPTIGEFSPEIIRKAVNKQSEQSITFDTSNIPVRPPVLCPGCHHRGVFYSLKKMNINVSGDIGCYTLAAFPPMSSMDTSICMGASIGMALGFEKARGIEFAAKSVAVIGDSTFWHSGVTGLIDVVYNKGHTTVIILDNSITAMTGHQENPSTGKTLTGCSTVQIDFEKLARSIGINRVQKVDAYDVDAFESILKEELASNEVSVIITKRPCILLKSTPKVFGELKVDTDKCKGCRMCMKIGCPSISFENGKASIDPTLCVGCKLCIKMCKFDAIVKKEEA